MGGAVSQAEQAIVTSALSRGRVPVDRTWGSHERDTGMSPRRLGTRWLGRKDSNLQPSDPESAALPLRHSPSTFRRVAGRTIVRTSRRPARLLLDGGDVRLLNGALAAKRH